MSNIRYYNQSAPFWDFIASFHDRNAPGANMGGGSDSGSQPWDSRMGGGWGPFAYRNNTNPDETQGHAHHSTMNNDNDADADADVAPPTPSTLDPEKHPDGPSASRHQPPPVPPPGMPAGGPPPPPHYEPGPHHEGHHHSSHGCRGRGNWSRGNRTRGGGPFESHHHRHGGHGYSGPRGFNNTGPHTRSGPEQAFGFGPSLNWLPEFIHAQVFGPGQNGSCPWVNNNNNNNNTNNSSGPPGSETFTPAVDVFDTPASFILHVSLPGAHREDIGVHYDAEHSEVVIAGVVHRPGDEALLATLAMGERGREIGAFERRVRVGNLASPALVDADGVVAKLEDGLLRIEVPKVEGGFVQVRKVDVE